jgi:hypothetical protein
LIGSTGRRKKKKRTENKRGVAETMAARNLWAALPTLSSPLLKSLKLGTVLRGTPVYIKQWWWCILSNPSLQFLSLSLSLSNPSVCLSVSGWGVVPRGQLHFINFFSAQDARLGWSYLGIVHERSRWEEHHQLLNVKKKVSVELLQDVSVSLLPDSCTVNSEILSLFACFPPLSKSTFLGGGQTLSNTLISDTNKS